MKFGKFQASFLPYLTFLVFGSSIIIIYFIAVYLGQEKPFPNTWISNTADHYPQYIIFRVSTISGAVLMLLSYFINHFIIMQKAYDNVINIRKYRPQITLIFGIMASIFIMGSTALLDTGKQDGNLHGICAGFFFIFSILANWYNWLISWIIFKKVKTQSNNIFYFKTIVALLIILQLYIKIFIASGQDNIESVIGNIIEYTASYTLLSLFVIIGFEAKKYTLIYDFVN